MTLYVVWRNHIALFTSYDINLVREFIVKLCTYGNEIPSTADFTYLRAYGSESDEYCISSYIKNPNY